MLILILLDTFVKIWMHLDGMVFTCWETCLIYLFGVMKIEKKLVQKICDTKKEEKYDSESIDIDIHILIMVMAIYSTLYTD